MAPGDVLVMWDAYVDRNVFVSRQMCFCALFGEVPRGLCFDAVSVCLGMARYAFVGRWSTWCQ